MSSFVDIANGIFCLRSHKWYLTSGEITWKSREKSTKHISKRKFWNKLNSVDLLKSWKKKFKTNMICLLCLCAERDEQLIDIVSVESRRQNVAFILHTHFRFCFEVRKFVVKSNLKHSANFIPFAGRTKWGLCLPEMLGESVCFSWILHTYRICATRKWDNIRGEYRWWSEALSGLKQRQLGLCISISGCCYRCKSRVREE